MALLNDHFLKLTDNSLLADIPKKVNAFKATHPKANLIDLGVSDFTYPIVPAVQEAIHNSINEMATPEGVRGYGPVEGYDFLRDAILKHDFLTRGIRLDKSEIFINDGAKSDIGNIQELLRWDNSVGVPDPTSSVYIHSNIMIGRAGINVDGKWSNITYLKSDPHNDFLPSIPDFRLDIIYLTSPNNPTGAAIPRDELKKWVDYAIKNDVLIFFDASYQAYIRDNNIPHTIYEIRGAKKIAIEFHSFSKSAGFSGIRCGYTVIPKELTVAGLDTRRYHLNPLWQRRQQAKYNGTSYIVQRAAEATYTNEAQKDIRLIIDTYMRNASIMREGLKNIGFSVYGGINSPYIWLKTPKQENSYQFFEHLLYAAHVICTPGKIFGPSGDEYVRFSAFQHTQQCIDAIERIRKWQI
ncbi:MAG: LL-diaminopimelate aminotransferase [Bacteroidaceae bacterium]|nr:LL-diaminopimelate aminotransferase [Bacteroidaceae bacterium]